jgi:lipid A 4'-phosphatase
MMRPETKLWRTFLFSGAVVAFAIFFAAFPKTDITVSVLFGDANGFPLSSSPFLNGFRSVMFMLTDWVMALALLMLVLGLLPSILRIFTARFLSFAVTSYIVGPGLIVNGILKTYSGRVRPRNIDIFGGNDAFSPVFDFAGQCQSNCSFVSGEASALATVATILLIAFVPRLPQSNRIIVQIAILSVAVSGSLLRVAFGAHFLSDVIFAWFISIAVVAGLYKIFKMERLGLRIQQNSQPSTLIKIKNSLNQP